MPSTIPYDPSLVLANVVSKEALSIVESIGEAQAPADSAQDNLNALLASRRSLDMTKTELAAMGIKTDPIDEAVKDLNDEIVGAAKDYAKQKIDAESKVRFLRSKIRSVHSAVESPVDYVKTEIKSMPLAADSINMDVQYFSMDTVGQNAATFASTISTYVSNRTSFLGVENSRQATGAAQSQVSQQVEKHKIVGTLVISVQCMHKNASVLAPFVLNVDKGIKVWNHLFPGDRLVPTNRADLAKLVLADDPDGSARFGIISGTTFGSSFVGMVHVINSTSTEVSQSLTALTASLQSQMDAAAWFESQSGGYGVNASIGNDVKSLLSAQNVTSHVTLICMGVIPSIVANDVKMGVEKFAEFNPQANMQAIATIQNATVADQGTIKQSADAARTGQQMVSLKGGEIKAALSALAAVDDGANKILDINSMMTALDDYLKKAAENQGGVPLNYYVKDITKSMLAEMWVAKYLPGKYTPQENDDTTPQKPTGNGGGAGGNASGGAGGNSSGGAGESANGTQ